MVGEGFDLVDGMAVTEQGLSAEVVGKGEGLEKLVKAEHAVGVAVAVDALDVRGETCE